MILKIATFNAYICRGQTRFNDTLSIEIQYITFMKKAPFPIWNIITMLMIGLFMIGFYLNGKLTLNLTWEGDWVKVLAFIFVFFWSCLRAGIECNKISEVVISIEKMRVDKHHALYEYLRSYITKYKDSEHPKKDVLKNALLIRLIYLNTNKSIEVATDEICKHHHIDEKNKIIELNMLIDHWIEEFIKDENARVNDIIMNKNKRRYKNKSTNYIIEVSQENQFNTISFLLSNVCIENVNNDKLEKF